MQELIDTVYLIGNGPRSIERVRSLKDKQVFSLTNSAFEFDSWGFQPRYFGALELPVHKDNFLKFIDKTDLLFKKTRMTIFLPEWLTKYRILPSNVVTKRRYDYNMEKPYHAPNAFQVFGNLGPNCAYIIAKFLGFPKIILLGFSGHIPGDKKKSDAHVRAWRRFAKCRDMAFPNLVVLNASRDSHVDCFPKCDLDGENQFEVENPDYWKTH